jgi:hypothetical protein
MLNQFILIDGGMMIVLLEQNSDVLSKRIIMKNQPVKVIVIGKEANCYKIKFPNLQIPVTVNESLYHKMLRSNEFEIEKGVLQSSLSA